MRAHRIIHPRPLQRGDEKGESAGLDNMGGGPEAGGGAQDGADVSGDVGLEQGNFHKGIIAAPGEGIEVDARGVMPNRSKGKLSVGKAGLGGYQAGNSRRGRRAAAHPARANTEIGRASWRESGGTYRWT